MFYNASKHLEYCTLCLCWHQICLGSNAFLSFHHLSFCVWCVICVQQHALRLMAFGQIYKVLEMEPLPSNKPSQKYPWSDKEGVYLFFIPHCCSACPSSSRSDKALAVFSHLSWPFWVYYVFSMHFCSTASIIRKADILTIIKLASVM